MAADIDADAGYLVDWGRNGLCLLTLLKQCVSFTCSKNLADIDFEMQITELEKKEYLKLLDLLFSSNLD